MSTRSEQLRRQHRRILGWSLGVAVVAHILVFVLSPTFRTQPLMGADTELDTLGLAAGANAVADLLFRAPILQLADDSSRATPAERTLETQREVRVPERCLYLTDGSRAPVVSHIRLRVRASGRVDVLGIERTSGDACADDILREAAGALWYHWLPSERFPAPLELDQPVMLVGVR